MTTEHLTIRRLLVDLQPGFSRHWNGGDAFRTAFTNALSMSFPVGEQFFIDAMRNGARHLPDTPEFDGLRKQVQDFVGQEATHRHLHGLFNQQLEKQGLINHWGPRAARRLAHGRMTYLRKSEKGHLHELAITAAYEHFTAIFGDQTLARMDQAGDWFAGAEEPLLTLWRWHASEETEHKSVALDLYRALEGNERWRRRWFYYVVFQFITDSVRQTTHNLWRDGSLHKPSTWWSGLKMLLGRHGMLWTITLPLLAYLRPQFHPKHIGEPALAARWLEAHRDRWIPVGAPRR